jgi:hypothetical protein
VQEIKYFTARNNAEEAANHEQARTTVVTLRVSSYIKCKNLTTDQTDKHGFLVSNLYFVRVGLCLSVVKLKNRSSAYHTP